LPYKLEYYHSTPYYDIENGVRRGEIKIIDLNRPLHEQEWMERDKFSVCHTLEGYLVDVKNNGIRRLKFVNEFHI
ncbi:MAG: hypothetical protein NZZ41_06940, partial [Candidatus Dojkabacteria bacterium]|nr:hypothetical protein [Candidatus Dojkabacteria bacterium]